VCSSDKVKSIIDLKAAGKIKNVGQMIVYDSIKPSKQDAAASNGLNLIKFQTALTDGRNN
jgi:hypothetical protein